MDHIDHIDHTKDWRFPLWLQRTWVSFQDVSSQILPKSAKFCRCHSPRTLRSSMIWPISWRVPTKSWCPACLAMATPCDVQETGSSMVHLDHGPLGRFLQSLLPTRHPSLQPSVDVMKMTRQGHNRDTTLKIGETWSAPIFVGLKVWPHTVTLNNHGNDQ